MDKVWIKIKQAWEDNPLQVILVGAVAATAAAKLIDASSNARSRKTWDREVSRRVRNSR